MTITPEHRYAWTPEQAKKASRRAQEVKAARAAARALDPLHDIRAATADLMGDLLKAAKGNPPFDDLPADKRLAALFRALEYAAGKPLALGKQDKPEAEDEPPKEAEGITIE